MSFPIWNLRRCAGRLLHFSTLNKPVGAICHGVIAAARAVDPKTNKSVLYGRKTTALLQRQEMTAYNLTKHLMNDYYLTYPTTVESEVRAALKSPDDFLKGKNPVFRDSAEKLKRGVFSCRRQLHFCALAWRYL